MDSALLALLADPVDHTALRLDGDVLVSDAGRAYRIREGVPRFVTTEDLDQRRTEKTFAYKWGRRESYERGGMQKSFGRWLLQRYGFEDRDELRAHFGRAGRLLDAGCGGGLSASVWLESGWATREDSLFVGADISDAVDVARDRLGAVERTAFVQADVLGLPFRDGAFDLVFSEGVLHHTPSTRAGLDELARVLRSGGEAFFYVYRRKAPLRELADDHLRKIVSDLEPTEAWEALRPLTGLARSLAELGAEVDVPEDVPLLGIRAGRYDVQRLVYWHFAKLFWNPELSDEENVHVSFDWYHPRYAHRHTEEEVRCWCDELGLDIRRFDAQESGFTVRAVKS